MFLIHLATLCLLAGWLFEAYFPIPTIMSPVFLLDLLIACSSL